MPTLVQRKSKDGTVKVLKFKKFKIVLDFDSRDDAMQFADSINPIAPEVAQEIVFRASR
jgi:hypothetical protein